MNQKTNPLPGAGPFYFKGNEIGILLLHGGGGGTAADLRPLAEDIHKRKGWTVSVPLLPGFGTSPEYLKDTEVHEWKTAVELEISNLKEKCNVIIGGGHSMGAMLTLIFAAQKKYDAFFTIAAPIGIKGIKPKLAPLAQLFMTYYPVNSEEFRKETDGKWVGYDKIPLNIVLKMRKLLKEMKKGLQKIKCPALLMQGKNDEVIKKKSMQKILNKISSSKKRAVVLENNEHTILQSPDHNQIMDEIIKFIENQILTK